MTLAHPPTVLFNDNILERLYGHSFKGVAQKNQYQVAFKYFEREYFPNYHLNGLAIKKK